MTIPLLPFDLWGEIALYEDVETLLALDLTCHTLRNLTDRAWAARAHQQFGIQRIRGKDAYRSGVSLTGRPRANYVIQLANPAGEYQGAFSGSPVLAQNENIVAFSSDARDHSAAGQIIDGELVPHHPIQIRDAKTLEIKKYLECHNRVWEIAICGPVGSEIIVITTLREVIAFRDDQSTTIYNKEGGAHLTAKILGKHDKLLVFRNGTLFVHHIGPGPELALPCFFESSIASPDDFYITAAVWSYDCAEVAFCAHANTILIWNVADANPYEAQRIVAVETSIDPAHYSSIAFNSMYVACVVEDTETIVVFDRATGGFSYKVTGTTGVVQFSQLDDDSSPTMVISIAGHQLISSSIEGCMLGVWDLRTGEPSYRMLHRTSVPNFESPSCMVQLSGWSFHAFVTTTHREGELALWGFPECKEDEDRLSCIMQREAGLREHAEESSDGSAAIDFVDLGVGFSYSM